MKSGKSSRPSRAEQVYDIPLLEKVICIFGILTVVLVLSILAYEAKIYDDKPPEIHLKALEVVSQEHGFLVKFLASNKGSQTAAQMEIEGRVGEETSTMTLDYLPAHSTREGGLFFKQNPEGLELRALGFQKP